jgi:hypothetical protein
MSNEVTEIVIREQDGKITYESKGCGLKIYGLLEFFLMKYRVQFVQSIHLNEDKTKDTDSS